jgi:formylglycine-generating enzyme required for sulfatase activity
MTAVPAGSFEMAADHHKITIAKPFAVSKFAVTYANWDRCVSAGGCDACTPRAFWGRGQIPVQEVSWLDAQHYIAWLSAVTGKTYRLLTDAEYEYAQRAGTTTDYPWGNSIKLDGKVMANCGDCGDAKELSYPPMPVGSFPPNKFGLYDMVGNRSSWTEDCYHDFFDGAPSDGTAWLSEDEGHCEMRIMRGSGPDASAYSMKATSRDRQYVDTKGGMGFRVARTLDTH